MRFVCSKECPRYDLCSLVKYGKECYYPKFIAGLEYNWLEKLFRLDKDEQEDSRVSTMEEDFGKMNSDGYEQQYKQCSNYEIPREPKFYTNNSELPNIPIYNVKELKSNGNRICDTCNKEDVCMYKSELAQAAKEITQISERENVFIDTDVRCKKWSGKVFNVRGKSLKDEITWLEEDYVTGKGR